MQSTFSKMLVGFITLLVIASAALCYYLIEANKRITQQSLEITAANQSLKSAESAIVKLESSSRDFRNQLSILRVAMQQSTNIRIDSSGALITKKGSKPDGIELR